MKKTIDRHYRFDEVTAYRIREKSRAIGVTESECIRRLILSDSTPVNPEDIMKIVRSIAEIAGGINRISVVATETGIVSRDLEQIRAFRTELGALRRDVLQLKLLLQGGDG